MIGVVSGEGEAEVKKNIATFPGSQLVFEPLKICITDVIVSNSCYKKESPCIFNQHIEF